MTIFRNIEIVHWLLAVVLVLSRTACAETNIATFDYRVTGVQLEVSPPVLSVPKGIAGSLNVRLAAGADGASAETSGWVEGTLRGPSFEARRVVGRPNQPLLLPALPVVGDYQLDNIRLVDAATGATVMEGMPSSVPVRVFEDVLVSRVTSHALTSEEIQTRGIFIDEANYRAVEFEIQFALGGGTVSVGFPVIAPVFPDPAVQFVDPEREAERLRFAQEFNEQHTASVAFPEALQRANLDLQVRPVLLRYSGARPPGLPSYAPPPIAGLIVIPGRIGFLNQFFAVQVYVENASPDGSGLSVTNVRASLVLPAGDDRVTGTFATPGDDPLRFARVGPDAEIFSTLPVVRPGADGVHGTRDDLVRMQPGEGGQAEFLVEGLREGLHIMDVNLTATLEGLAAGPVEVSGLAAGSVFVRNPKFALAFTHPRTVRTGESFTASFTILNTGQAAANGATITLPGNALSGTRLAAGQSETVTLGDILPGESVTADFRMVSERTGYVRFSNFTSGGDVQGFFRFRGGVDERGVELSPDTLAYPDLIKPLQERAPDVFTAANRVLGQALGASQRGLPPGVIAVESATIQRRMRELLEAGQRLSLGDEAVRVFTDLLLDWQGLRVADTGFDQLLRSTAAGRHWREAVMRAAYPAAGDAVARLSGRAADFAGLGAAFWEGASSLPALEAGYASGRTGIASAQNSTAANAMVYVSEGGGSTAVFMGAPQGDFTWTATADAAAANIVLLEVRADGKTIQRTWTVGPLTAETVLRYSPGFGADMLNVDTTGDGFPESTLAPALTTINELAPQVLFAVQDLSVLYARPGNPDTNAHTFCDEIPKYLPPGAPLDTPDSLRPFYMNYGMVLALLYNKPVNAAGVGDPAFYALNSGLTLNNGIKSGAVKLQEGTRVAYLGLQQGVGTFRPRGLVVSGGKDPRGHPLVTETIPVQAKAEAGAPVKGRVIRGDNTPGAFLPVTLTYIEHAGADCPEFPVRAVQTLTNANGEFAFDFVMGGIAYKLDVVELTGFSPEVAAILQDAALHPDTLRERLTEITALPGVGTRLLEDFGTDNLPAAFTLAQSLDRASFSDSIAPAKYGVEQEVVLRFRGRAALLGQVLQPDGHTPASGVAVTYFPPVNSTETSYTLLSGADGRFAFLGSPLGVFGLQAASLDNRQLATLYDTLTEPGGQKNVILRLVDRGGAPDMQEVRGRVFASDGSTPSPHARVLLRHESAQSWLAEAAEDGTFRFPAIPPGGIALLAVDAERRFSGLVTSLNVAVGGTNFFTVSLGGTANARGRVLWASDRTPVAGAVVSGGRELVTSAADGTFTLEEVATGGTTLVVAGLPAGNGRPFPRIGSAHAAFQLGDNNFVEVLLPPEGGVFGTVFDPAGHPAANTEVALNMSGAYQIAVTNAAGEYRFDNLNLKTWTVAAPAPPAAERQAANTGAGDPLLNEILDLASATNPRSLLQPGATQNLVQTVIGMTQNQTAAPPSNDTGADRLFLPEEWGYSSATLVADGVRVRADIHLQRRVNVAGVVLNAQDTPIGADVEVSGIVPGISGEPNSVIVARESSDPGTGRWSFASVLYAGSRPQPFRIAAHSPFFPQPATYEGQLTAAGPDLTNVVLKFPSTVETSGKLGITVVDAAGQPVGEGFPIRVNYLDDYEIRTEANGRQETIPLPQRTYTIEAGERDVFGDPIGPVGTIHAQVVAGVTTEVTLQLLATGNLSVRVETASGVAVNGARVAVQQAGFPRSSFDLITGADGKAGLTGIYAGDYSLKANATSPAQRLYGSANATVMANEITAVVVRLEPTGNVSGQFVRADGSTPVGGAMVGIAGSSARIYVPTDNNGRFNVEGVALGAVTVDAVNPVTGLRARAETSLSFDGQSVSVLLVEETPGEVTGRVLGAEGTSTVSGATVTLQTHRTPQEPTRVTLTGPDGTFSFGGISAGSFLLRAEVNLPVRNTGQAPGELRSGQARAVQDVALSPLGSVTFTVKNPDGSPAFPASVQFHGHRDTDDAGRVEFVNVPVFAATWMAQSQVAATSNSFAQGTVRLTQPGEHAEVAVTLSGVGRVTGKVTLGDGLTAVPNAPVTLRSRFAYSGIAPVVTADGDGRFSFDNVAVAGWDVSTALFGLRGLASGEIATGGEVDNVLLKIEAAGTVRGRLLAPDGTTPVAGLAVALAMGQSHAPVFVSRVTDADGRFAFDSVPVTPNAWRFAADGVTFFGQVRRSGQLTTNGDVADLGDLVFDNTPLRVTATLPVAGEANAATAGPFRVEFSERLDPATVDRRTIYLATANGAVVSAQVMLAAGSDSAVEIQPWVPLAEDAAYQLIVLDGDRDLFGVPVSGPRDANGLALAAAFVMSFRTADETPPRIIAQFPADDAAQVDPAIAPRLTFSEPIDPAALSLSLNGPAGQVVGSWSAILNNLAASFVPAHPLAINATYTLTVQGVKDMAGNPLPGQPLTITFHTLDTLGPAIAMLRLAGGATATGDATVMVEAILTVPEAGARLRLFANGVVVGETTQAGDLDLPFTLPSSGTITFTAVAIDVFGNESAPASLPLNIIPNQPPGVTFALLEPAPGPLLTGRHFKVRVTGVDDSGVTALHASIGGALVVPMQSSNGTPIELTGIVPPTAGPGSLTVFAYATDNSGLTSGAQSFSWPVEDATPPDVTFTAPTADTVFSAGDTILLELDVTDNFGVSEVQVNVFTAFPFTQTLTYTPQPGVRSISVPVTVPAATPNDGSLITVQIIARDAAANFTGAVRYFRMTDLVRPTAHPDIADGAINIHATKVLTAQFDRAVDPATVNGTTVRLLDAAQTPVPGLLEYFPASRYVWFTPEQPLRFGAGYTFVITDGVRGVNNLPANPLQRALTVAPFNIVQPAANTVVAEGQTVRFRANGPNELSITGVTFILPDGSEFTANAPGFETGIVIPPLASLGPPPHLFGARASFSGTPHTQALTSIPLTVRSNRAPVAQNDDVSAAAGQSTAFVAATMLFPNDSDPDGDALSLVSFTQPVSGTTASGGPDVIVYTPPAGFTGSTTFTYTVGDPFGQTATATVTVNVTTNNRPFVPEGYGSAFALRFDGMDDFLRVADHAALRPAAFTIEAWAYAESLTSYNVIGLKTSNTSWTDGYGLWGSSSDQAHLFVNNFTTPEATAPFTAGAWRHVAGTYDGTTLRTYIDGVLQSEVAATVPINHSPADLMLGGQESGSAGLFAWHGILDEIRFWNRALPAAEISARHAQSLPGSEPGLTGRWGMEEGAGLTAASTSAGGHHAVFPAAAESHPEWKISTAPIAGPNATLPEDGTAALVLSGRDPDGQPITARVLRLPLHGKLYQTTDGLTATTQITSVPAAATHAQRRIVYVPEPGFSGTDVFNYEVHDGVLASPAAAFRLTVSDATTVVWRNAANGNWNTAANWSPARVPGPGDHAVINVPGTYTVTINIGTQTPLAVTMGGPGVHATLRQTGGTFSPGIDSVIGAGTVYELTGGMLGGTATLSIFGTFTWTGGSMAGAGRTVIAATAAGTISTISSKDLSSGRILENAGTLTASGGLVYFNFSNLGGGAVINNLAGATFEVQGAIEFRANYPSPGSAVNNAGLFRKTGGGTTRLFGNTLPLPLNNTGTVQISEGTLQLEDGGNLGNVLHVASGGVLRLNGGDFVLPAGTRTEGQGLLVLAGGVGTVSESLTHSGTVSLTGGTWTFGPGQTFSTFMQSGGLLRGTGTVTVTDTFTWTGGSMADAGRTIIAATAAGTISTVSSKDLSSGRILENAGTLTASGGLVYFNISNLGGGAVINNLAGATFEVQGAVEFRSNYASPGSAVNNAGLFRKTGSGITRLFGNSLPLPLNNTGTVQISEGTLRLDSGGNLGNVLHVATGAVLRLDGGSFVLPAGTRMEGQGLLLLAGDSGTVSETLTHNGTVSLTGGTWTFDSSQTFSTFMQSGGLLRGTGTVTVTDTFTWTGGSMADAGRTVIAATAAGTISTNSAKDLSSGRVLENAGTLTASGGLVYFNISNLGGGAVINNLAGATFETQGAIEFRSNYASPGSAINNAGLFRKTGGGLTRLFGNGLPLPLNNTGTIHMISGTLQPQSGFTQNGTLQGSGTIAGAAVKNNGLVLPDPAPGGLTIFGTFEQTAAGRLKLTLGEAVAPQGHLSLTISGLATWNGALEIALAYPFAEPAASSFPVVSFGSRAGDFIPGAVSGLTNNFGYSFSRAFTAGALNLTVTQAGDVPQPPGPAPFPNGFDQWLTPRAAAAGIDTQLGPLDDADSDGAVNFLEYALGSDPFKTASRPVLLVRVAAGSDGRRLWLEYRRRTGIASVRYEILRSSDMQQWSLLTGLPEPIAKPIPGEPDLEKVLVDLGLVPSPLPAGFFSIRVSQSAGETPISPK